MNFSQMLQPLLTKIMFLFGRGKITRLNATDNTGSFGTGSTKTSNPQRLQMNGLKSEVLTSIERAQEYGLETWPIPAATSEAIIACINGNRSYPIVLCVKDDAYRPLDLSEGDVCLYTKFDKTTGHRIHLVASTKAIEMTAAKYKLSNQAGTIEFLDLIDQLLTLLQGNVDTVGIASTGTNSLILAQLATLQTKLQSIKG